MHSAAGAVDPPVVQRTRCTAGLAPWSAPTSADQQSEAGRSRGALGHRMAAVLFIFFGFKSLGSLSQNHGEQNPEVQPDETAELPPRELGGV